MVLVTTDGERPTRPEGMPWMECKGLPGLGNESCPDVWFPSNGEASAVDVIKGLDPTPTLDLDHRIPWLAMAVETVLADWPTLTPSTAPHIEQALAEKLAEQMGDVQGVTVGFNFDQHWALIAARMSRIGGRATPVDRLVVRYAWQGYQVFT